MAKIDTLLDKLCTKPTPADFRFSDLRKIMTYFGYLESNKGATSGSRVKFYHPETQAVLLAAQTASRRRNGKSGR